MFFNFDFKIPHIIILSFISRKKKKKKNLEALSLTHRLHLLKKVHTSQICYLHTGTVFLPLHLRHTSTTGICHLFCTTLNLGSTAFYGLWTTIPWNSVWHYVLQWPIRHPGGKPLCRAHQHCKYTSPNYPAAFCTASSRASTSLNSFLTLSTNNVGI